MKSLLKILVLAVLALAIAPNALADSWTVSLGPTGCSPASCAGYTFTTTVSSTATPGTFNLSFTVSKTPGAANAYLQGFGLTIFTGSVDGTYVSSNPDLGALGFTMAVSDNSKINNGNGQCGSGNHPGSLCITVNSSTGNGYLLNNSNNSVTFNFTVVGAAGTGVQDSWHIMTSGTTCASGNNCGNVFALSNDGSPNHANTTVPEPASVLLGAAGLTGLFVRRKLRK